MGFTLEDSTNFTIEDSTKFTIKDVTYVIYNANCLLLLYLFYLLTNRSQAELTFFIVNLRVYLTFNFVII